MRRFRRGGNSGLEFSSSGEDSFVAVVVTKLTGALLFILLLTMVIMALLPKAVDLGQASENAPGTQVDENEPVLQITSLPALPDAIAGRPYTIALAATGARGPLQWSTAGPLPSWLALDAQTGQLSGTPPKPEDQAIEIPLQVSDGTQHASRTTRLDVLAAPAASPGGAWWNPRWAAVPWDRWLEHGIGFLVLWIVHLLGMNLLGNLEQHGRSGELLAQGPAGALAIRRRFASYRVLLRIATLSATVALVAYLVVARRP
jgi:hypothetical protein